MERRTIDLLTEESNKNNNNNHRGRSRVSRSSTRDSRFTLGTSAKLHEDAVKRLGLQVHVSKKQTESERRRTLLKKINTVNEQTRNGGLIRTRSKKARENTARRDRLMDLRHRQAAIENLEESLDFHIQHDIKVKDQQMKSRLRLAERMKERSKTQMAKSLAPLRARAVHRKLTHKISYKKQNNVLLPAKVKSKKKIKKKKIVVSDSDSEEEEEERMVKAVTALQDLTLPAELKPVLPPRRKSKQVTEKNEN